MAAHSQWYVHSPFCLCVPGDSRRAVLCSPARGRLCSHGELGASSRLASLLCSASKKAAPPVSMQSPMSHDSLAQSPGERRLLGPSTDDHFDVYDANIRNFAPVARIMKNALPENAKIAKEAKECMQECVSEFISFITSEGACCPLPQRATECALRPLRRGPQLTSRSV